VSELSKLNVAELSEIIFQENLRLKTITNLNEQKKAFDTIRSAHRELLIRKGKKTTRES